MPIPERLAAALGDRYRLERELGQGGMATVYLAEDLKHGRKVAVKVLKPELAAVLGAERFVVEIRTTAALQHPHILPLFDSGTADGFLFYVMPFIQGETLRARLDRETQLGVDEAVRLTREVADALHHAHTQGVVHRDIKPENILLANGRPMVADFGIALAVSAAAGGRMTETGLSLGTPHYMSPEQATADKEITGRSDVYSLASVCYEMLTGHPPHVGSSAQQIIMKIITEPAQPVTAFRRTVPPHVAAAVAQALEKLPADRFESAAQFAAALANPAFTSATAAYAHPAAAGASRGALVAASAVAALAVAAAAWLARRPAPAAPVARYRLALPDSQAPLPLASAPALAPDGSFLVYRGPVPGTTTTHQLWVKRREEEDASPIAGTRDAGEVSVSPDGTRLAFDHGGTLRVLPVTGGSPITVVSTLTVLSLGLDWLDDGTIAFVAPSTTHAGVPTIWVVGAAGGEPRELGLPTEGRAAALPHAIPGRHAIVFLSCSAPTDCDLHVHDARSGGSTLLVAGSGFGVVSPSGHLLYERGGRLMGVRFDTARLRVVGEPVVLLERFQPAEVVLTPLCVAGDGTMALVTTEGDLGSSRQELVWVDRSGQVELVDPGMTPVSMHVVNANHGWALSPDGTRVAIGLHTEAGDDVWVKQLPRGALTRVTFGPEAEFRPEWTPDGRSVLFITPAGVRVRRADGAGEESAVTNWPANEAQLSHDGQWLVARGGAGGRVPGGRDIVAMRVGQDSIPRPILASVEYDETAPMLSPDSRWLLYQSNESGRNEIYLRPFPDVDRLRVQVSVGGGETPLWSRDGREIFFVSADRRMMAATFAVGAPPTVAVPRALFALPAALLDVETAYHTPWDVAADGRFLMARSTRARADTRSEIILTHNYVSELRRRLPR